MTTPGTWAIGGASGLVGTALQERLRGAGHRVVALVRREARGADEVRWDPSAKEIDDAALEGIDGIVNLAGENLFALRWTEEKKRRIVDSRIDTTSLIGGAIERMKRPPAVWVNASAIGIYGSDRPGEILTERASAGDDFLAETCAAWERAAKLPQASTRIARIRTGIVLATKGGALAQMLTPFRMGVGGRIGSGRQWMSWIGLHDAVRAIEFLLESSVAGPVNLVAPGAVENREFTRILAAQLSRPAILPLPSAAIRLALGEMGEALLLSDQRVVPHALTEAGFEFDHPELERALRFLLG